MGGLSLICKEPDEIGQKDRQSCRHRSQGKSCVSRKRKCLMIANSAQRSDEVNYLILIHRLILTSIFSSKYIFFYFYLQPKRHLVRFCFYRYIVLCLLVFNLSFLIDI